MRRMGSSAGGGGSDDWSARNMSYTNLAAMAESFEVGARLIPAVGTSGGRGTSGADLDKLYLQAQELINTGSVPNTRSPRARRPQQRPRTRQQSSPPPAREHMRSCSRHMRTRSCTG